MADVVTRFRLETTQFDSKLRDASKSLADISREASKAGKGFSDFTKDSVEAARALGQTESSAATTKDKLKELVNAFNDAAKAYNGLTEEQKRSDFGKAMSDSLDQLKVRIADTKQELQNVGSTMKATSADGNGLNGILGGLADKFGLNITKLGVMGTALGATTGALKVAKDAFFASEANLDSWNSMVYTSQSVYEGFLTALNTGDISGYLSRINQIVDAAKEAYKALDTLATQKALSAGPLGDMKNEARRLDDMLRYGVWIGDPEKNSGSMKEGQKLTTAQLQALRRQRGNLQNRIEHTQTTLLGSATDALGKLYKQSALKYGLSKSDFIKGTENLDTYNANMAGYDKYLAFEKAHTTKQKVGTGYLGGGSRTKWVRDNVANPYAQYRGWGVFKDDSELQETIGRTQQERNAIKSDIYSTRGQMYRTFNRVENRLSGGGGGRTGGGGGRGGGGGTHTETAAEKAAKLIATAEETYAKTVQTAALRFETGMDNSETQQKKLLAAQERLAMAYADAYNLTQSDEYKTQFETEAGEYNQMADVVKGKRDLFDTATQDLAGMSVLPMEEILKGLLGEDMQTYAKRKGFDINTGGGERRDASAKFAEAADKIDKRLAPINTISSGLQDLGVEVPAGIERMIAVTQGVSTILTGISMILSLIQVDTKIAATASVADSIIPFKNGGIVPHAAGGYVAGNHYSGDVTPIMANAGEVVLNRAQVGNLASQLQGMGNVHLEAVIEGEDIRLALQNGDRRRGRGEYVTTKSR